MLPVDRHAFQQSAEPIHVARSRAVLHRSGSQKQEAFEQRMIDHVQERAQKSQNRHRGNFIADAEHPHAESHRDDPDIFDAGIGQQSFQIMLGQGEQDAKHARRRADAH